MYRTQNNLILTLAMLLSLAACSHDEPVNPIKPLAERTLLLLDEHGNIYDHNGNMTRALPNCLNVTQIITEDDDYFVSGVNSKMKVGYWKNGKWTTLHVDFIDDVDHWTFGIAKWDYNIYLLDPPNVLKNSGIFRLEDCERFSAANHGISVSEGYCFVVGTEFIDKDEGFDQLPVVFYEHKGVFKKKILPAPQEIRHDGEGMGICAYNGNHYLACGYLDKYAMMWNDGVPSVLPGSYPEAIGDESQTRAFATHIAKVGERICAAGYETRPDGKNVAIMWTDNVPKHLIYGQDSALRMTIVADIEAYGDDFYVLTREVKKGGDPIDNSYSVVWLNGEAIAKLDMPLISIAVY